jgi:DNA modification methylase
MPDADFYKFLLEAYKNMLAAVAPGGAIYVCHSDTEGVNFRKALLEAGWLLKQCIIWVKNSLVLGGQDYHWQHEPILYGWKPGAAHNWNGDRKQTTTWEIDRPSRSSDHPTMKPIELCAKAINNSSRSDDIVLDPFGGSGSTLIAAEQTGRTCYTMELDPVYCDVIIRRWEELTGKKAAILHATEKTKSK